ncbi:uncharacterized protein LOC100745239 isoform X1 [Bombus impatiens]|uniref:Uncharacterized protein LOC100745239 isoform X1 n=1 Tax=Bombus impatiens TaxID=132113 RepID=A0A6P8LF32_BOMIM|nr:uncharacterized protein LOC100745239 isoform X1 [Bombus impatiens]
MEYLLREAMLPPLKLFIFSSISVKVEGTFYKFKHFVNSTGLLLTIYDESNHSALFSKNLFLKNGKLANGGWENDVVHIISHWYLLLYESSR